MSVLDNTSMKKNASESIVKVHIFTILGVCIAFGIINIASKAVVLGAAIAAAGVVTALVAFFALKNTSTTTRGIILSQVQLLIIIVMSVTKHELYGMFPLMLASMAIAAVYYSKLNLVIHWSLMDAASVVGFIFKDLFYSDTSVSLIIKGILGINIGAFLVYYLVKCSLNYINESEDATHEADKLLVQVREQMNAGEELMEKQQDVVRRIAEISENVSSSSNLMLEISDKISSAAEEQEQTINEISDDITMISEETKNGMNESSKAADAAEKSTGLVKLSNEEMQNMLAAMAEITESSHKIESIIKTIEDIAFQTNILALNAAVEAARAGAAGKGFAVVADEVRNLANRSAEAVKNTSSLIQTSIAAVEKGTTLAEQAAEHMESVMKSSENSAEHAKQIAELTSRQTEAIASVRQRMDQISLVISQSLQTAVESSDIARSVADEAKLMDEIVSGFRN